jgi:hypothetical protein
MRKMAIGGAIALSMTMLPAAALAADDDEMMMGSMVPHPAHIHVGECPAPGDVIAPLNDVTVVGNDAQGAETHIHVDVSTTTVQVSLEDMITADHAVVVHNSVDDMGTYITCGNIGGHDVDGSFLVGLGPVADSGFAGMAWLTDNGDGTTDVSVTVAQTGDSGMDSDMDDDMDDDDMDSDMDSDLDMDDDDMEDSDG